MNKITIFYRRHLPIYLLAAFGLAVLLVRAKVTQSIFYFFLVWNLFLAYLPLAVTLFLREKPQLTAKWQWLSVSFVVWLLLLPNAPYIITDFIHLNKDSGMPLWFDILLLTTFSASGILFGLESMKDMQSFLATKLNSAIASGLMAAACLLSGLGIYIGRVLRFNSWDVLYKPHTLANTVVTGLTDPITGTAAWGITLGFGTLLFLMFRLYTPKKLL